MSQIQSRYQLDIGLLRMERQRTENDTALRQAKFDLREAKAAQVESLQNLLPKLQNNWRIKS